MCSELNPDNPREALAPLLGYRLVGPFDALALKGVIDPNDKKAFNLHYRYFYDPPEFQTVLVDVSIAGNPSSNEIFAFDTLIPDTDI